MSWWRGWWARLRGVVRRGAVEREMEEELRFHVDMEVEKHLRAGLSVADARRRARLAFGGEDRHREALRDGRRAPVVEGLVRDARFAVRALRRDWAVTLAGVVTLALGVGATTAVASIGNALLVRPLEIAEPERVVALMENRRGAMSQGLEGVRLPWGRYVSYEEATRDVFETLAAHRYATLALRAEDATIAVQGVMVTGNYFEVFGVRPAVGRFFAADEAPEAVLSHRLWRQRFGADPGVAGRVVQLDSRSYTVVGVAPPSFRGTSLAAPADVWVPIGARAGGAGAVWSSTWVGLVGRLRPGQSLAVAAERVEAVALRVPPDESQTRVFGADLEVVTGVPGTLRAPVAGFLALLLGLALLVLLIASANLAGMLLARSHARRRELAVRLAIGASRVRVVRHLLVENALLFLLGGASGVGLAWALTGWLAALPLPIDADLALDLSPDGAVLLFALALTVGTGLAFGLAPTVRSARPDVVSALKDGGGTAARSARGRRTFVTVQVAL